jgi:hypothetical protein
MPKKRASCALNGKVRHSAASSENNLVTGILGIDINIRLIRLFVIRYSREIFRQFMAQ